MYDFNYHRPKSLAEAAKLIGDNEDAKLVAGGMTLIPTLKQRLARPMLSLRQRLRESTTTRTIKAHTTMPSLRATRPR